MVEITDQIVRTVRIENHPQQHHLGRRRRRIIIRVPPFMLIWAILFHSERIHPILHVPNSIAIKDWFHIHKHKYRYYHSELSTVLSSDNLDGLMEAEDEKKRHQHRHQKQYRNPCQRPGNYKMRT